MSTVADNLLNRADIDRLLEGQSAHPVNAGKVVKHIFAIRAGFDNVAVIAKSRLYEDEIIEVVWVKEVQPQDLDAQFAKLKEFADKHANTVFSIDTDGCNRMSEKLSNLAGLLEYNDSVHLGQPCFKKKNRTDYFNKKAMCYVKLARSISLQKVQFLKVKQPEKQKIKDQLGAMRVNFDDRSRYKVPNNQDLVGAGIKSMDFVDALSMIFYDEGAI